MHHIVPQREFADTIFRLAEILFQVTAEPTINHAMFESDVKNENTMTDVKTQNVACSHVRVIHICAHMHWHKKKKTLKTILKGEMSRKKEQKFIKRTSFHFWCSPDFWHSSLHTHLWPFEHSQLKKSTT